MYPAVVLDVIRQVSLAQRDAAAAVLVLAAAPSQPDFQAVRAALKTAEAVGAPTRIIDAVHAKLDAEAGVLRSEGEVATRAVAGIKKVHPSVSQPVTVGGLSSAAVESIRSRPPR